MAGPMATLRVTDLLKTYAGRRVVDGVSLEVESGEVVGLLGPNGAGKTTCFYMTIGLIRPDGGHILLDGEDITDYPMHVRARRGVGYLPQQTSVFRKLSVRQNILAILELFPLSRDEQFERADQLLEELGIRHLSDQIANVLVARGVAATASTAEEISRILEGSVCESKSDRLACCKTQCGREIINKNGVRRCRCDSILGRGFKANSVYRVSHNG